MDMSADDKGECTAGGGGDGVTPTSGVRSARGGFGIILSRLCHCNS